MADKRFSEMAGHNTSDKAGIVARIGNNLRRIRREKGLRIQDIAHEMGVSVHFLYQLEAGKVHDIKMNTLYQCARSQGVSVAALVK
jgi:transcriptional regulator with XRE-family HTH domain